MNPVFAIDKALIFIFCKCMNSFIVKMLTLLSFFGGPQYCSDLLKPYWGLKTAFIINFLPVGFMALGLLSIKDEKSDSIAQLVIKTGLAGMFFLFIQNTYTACSFITEGIPSDYPWIVSGMLIGLISSIIFLKKAGNFLRPEGDNRYNK